VNNTDYTFPILHFYVTMSNLIL